MHFGKLYLGKPCFTIVGKTLFVKNSYCPFLKSLWYHTLADWALIDFFHNKNIRQLAQLRVKPFNFDLIFTLSYHNHNKPQHPQWKSYIVDYLKNESQNNAAWFGGWPWSPRADGIGQVGSEQGKDKAHDDLAIQSLALLRNVSVDSKCCEQKQAWNEWQDGVNDALDACLEWKLGNEDPPVYKNLQKIWNRLRGTILCRELKPPVLLAIFQSRISKKSMKHIQSQGYSNLEWQ